MIQALRTPVLMLIARFLTALLLASQLIMRTRAVSVKPLRRAAALGVLRRLGSILEHNDGGSLAESLSIDIGGTLVKIVLYRRRDAPMQSVDGPPRLDLEDVEITQSLGALRELSVHVPELGGDLHFFVFETKQIEDVLGFFARFWPQVTSDPKLPPQITLRATGGGAYKHAEIFRHAGIKLKVGEEMDCIVLGLNFLMTCVPGEVFSVALRDTSPLASPRGETETALCCPVAQPPVNFLYVSIGSGVSIVEVRGRFSAATGVAPTRYRRVGGSSLGGSSFWGLVRLLTSCSTFDEVIRLTEHGASSNVDMLVSDIYGDGSHELGLGGDVIAASFGKIAMRREDEGARGPMFLWRYLSALLRHYEEGFWLVVLAVVSLPCFQFAFDRLGVVSFAEARAASTAMCGSYRAHDVALSLLRMVSNNIGHIATLSAQQCGLRHIVFGGSFIRDHPYTISTISSAVRFFSRGIVQARAPLMPGPLLRCAPTYLQSPPSARHSSSSTTVSLVPSARTCVAMRWPVPWNGWDRRHQRATSTRSNRQSAPCPLRASTRATWSDGLVPLYHLAVRVQSPTSIPPPPCGLMLRCYPPLQAQTFSEILPTVAGAPWRGKRTQLFTEQLIPPPDPQIVLPGSTASPSLPSSSPSTRLHSIGTQPLPLQPQLPDESAEPATDAGTSRQGVLHPASVCGGVSGQSNAGTGSGCNSLGAPLPI